MKAIILAAGGTRTSKGFPNNSKPKCLFHVNGKTLLGEIVCSLRESGVSDIRIIVGYKQEQIIAFNEKHKLGLEIAYNSKWAGDAINSLKVGLEGVKDDVLIMYGDIRINVSLVKKFLECKKPIVFVGVVPNIRLGGYGYAGILKVGREMLHVFKRPYKTGKNGGLGIRLAHFILREAIRPHSPKRKNLVAVLDWKDPVSDTDYYRQTDEGKGLIT